MIKANDFIKRWNSDIFPLIHFDKNDVSNLKLPNSAKTFLSEAGLPESAAPYLSFVSSENGGLSKLDQVQEAVLPREDHIYMGFTGEGDWVCIQEETGKVVYINHENENEEFFINSSLPQFAECLLEYQEFVKQIKSVNGRKAFLEKKASIHLLDWITKKIMNIDSKIVNEKGFWMEELNRYYIESTND